MEVPKRRRSCFWWQACSVWQANIPLSGIEPATRIALSKKAVFLNNLYQVTPANINLFYSEVEVTLDVYYASACGYNGRNALLSCAQPTTTGWIPTRIISTCVQASNPTLQDLWFPFWARLAGDHYPSPTQGDVFLWLEIIKAATEYEWAHAR